MLYYSSYMSSEGRTRIANKVDRFMELEGLRGVAAIMVVLFHSMSMFYPGFFYGQQGYSIPGVQNMRLEDNLYATPMMGLFTGSFAVAIFFVLSGFVLSIGFFVKNDESIIKRLAVKRYLRLMLPAFTAIILAYVILRLGLDDWKSQAAQITHSGWLSALWVQAPNLWEAITQGVYGVFATGGSTYNPVLWTLKVEFIGSFMIFGMALLFAKSKYRWVMYLIVLSLCFTTWYVAFIVGMIIADIFVHYAKVLKLIPKSVLIGGAIIGIGLGAFPATDIKGTVFELILIPFLTKDQTMIIYLTLGATLVTLATLLVPAMKCFFSHRKIAFLGKYSFSLYLIHLPILFLVAAGVFVGVYSTLGFHVAVLTSMIVTIVVTIPATFLFEKYVDRPSIKLSSVVADVYGGSGNFRSFLLQIHRHATYHLVQAKVGVIDCYRYISNAIN